MFVLRVTPYGMIKATWQFPMSSISDGVTQRASQPPPPLRQQMPGVCVWAVSGLSLGSRGFQWRCSAGNRGFQRCASISACMLAGNTGLAKKAVSVPVLICTGMGCRAAGRVNRVSASTAAQHISDSPCLSVPVPVPAPRPGILMDLLVDGSE